MFKQIILLIIFTLLGLGAGKINAQDESTQYIPHAITLGVLEGGREYFANNLEPLLENNGISLKELVFDGLEIKTGALSEEQLFPNDPKMVSLLKNIKLQLETYFQGLKFGNHDFLVQTGDLNIQVKFKRLGLEWGQDLLESSESWINLNIVAELESVDVRTSFAHLNDQGNNFLKQWGLEDIEFFMRPEGKVPRLILPLKLKIESGQIDVEVGDLNHNVQADWFDMAFTKFLAPELSLSIGEQTFPLNTDAVETIIRDQSDGLVEFVGKQALTWVEEAFPLELQKIINEQVLSGLTDVSELEPPGKPKNKDVSNFIWGLRPYSVGAGQEDMLGISLEGFLIDPDKTKDNHLSSTLYAKSAPKLEEYTNRPWDLALGLNRGFINKVIKLSYDRGYIKEVGKGTRLLSSPYIIVDRNDSQNFVVKVKVSTKVEGLGSVFIKKNPMKVDFSIKARAVVNRDGSLGVKLMGVKPGSVSISRDQVRWLYGTVLEKTEKTIKKQLQESSDFIESIPIPKNFFGIPLKLKGTAVSSQGHLILGVDLGK